MSENIIFNNKINTVLYNAISLLIDETFDQYDDKQEWFDMLQNELGVSAEELESLGIKITVDGGLERYTDINKFHYPGRFIDNNVDEFIEQEVSFRFRNGSKYLNISDTELAFLISELKKIPQICIDGDAIEAFGRTKLYEFRGLDVNKIEAMQGEIHNLRHELDGAILYDTDKVPPIEKRLFELTLKLDAYIQGYEFKTFDDAVNEHFGDITRIAEVSQEEFDLLDVKYLEPLSFYNPLLNKVVDCYFDNSTDILFVPSIFKVEKYKTNAIVDDALDNIRGIGVDQGSGYYVLNAFEIDGEKYNLIAEIFKSSEDNDMHYGIYYAVEYADGDNLFSDWSYTGIDDINELKTVVHEIANTDFSFEIAFLTRQKMSFESKLANAESRSYSSDYVKNKEFIYEKE